MADNPSTYPLFCNSIITSDTVAYCKKSYFSDLFDLPIEKALRLLLSRDILFEQFVLFISRRGEDTRKLPNNFLKRFSVFEDN